MTTIDRRQYLDSLGDRAVDVNTLRSDARVPQPLRDRMAGADMDADGRIEGARETGLMYDAAARYDRDAAPANGLAPNAPTMGDFGLMRAQQAVVRPRPVRGLGGSTSTSGSSRPTLNAQAGVNVVAYEALRPRR